ncbi:MAG: flagellar biosynthetic protein FliR [Planctomycetota bacterium]
MTPTESILLGTLTLVRVTAVVFTAPVLGGTQIPIRFRVLMAVTLTVFTAPMVFQVATPPAELDMMSCVFSELMIGMSLGLGVAILLAAARMVGTVIGQMASIPTMEQFPELNSPVGKLFGFLSIAAFVLVSGPELVVTSMIDTFVYLPVGSTLETLELSQLLIELLRQSFQLTLRGVAPAVAALLVSTLVIGVISRNYPQVNLLGLGLSSNLLVMMLAIFFTLGGCVWLFVDDFEQTRLTIEDALKAARQPSTVDVFAGGNQGASHVR